MNRPHCPNGTEGNVPGVPREVRINAGMTQSVFAAYMGVSIKTVEAWEGGRTHPTGPVFRLLDILAAGEETKYIVAEREGGINR